MPQPFQNGKINVSLLILKIMGVISIRQFAALEIWSNARKKSIQRIQATLNFGWPFKIAAKCSLQWRNLTSLACGTIMRGSTQSICVCLKFFKTLVFHKIKFEFRVFGACIKRSVLMIVDDRILLLGCLFKF